MMTDYESDLLRIARTSPSSVERRSAIVKLRDIRSDAVRPLLLDIIAHERANQNLRETAIKALGEVGLEGDLSVLSAIADGSSIELARFAQDAAKKAHARLSARLGQLAPSEYRGSLRAPIPKRVRYDVLARDGHRCVSCGRGKHDGAVLEVDHILPASRNGSGDLSNLQTLCKDCNQGKSNRHSRDLRQDGTS